jgi:phage FluMu protein Com
MGDAAMQEIRCGQCNKKLAEGVFSRLSIKCSRCHTINHFEGHAPQQTQSARSVQLHREKCNTTPRALPTNQRAPSFPG